jgi:hypothetical protein
MSRQRPDNVIFIVADSLRYDSVTRQGASSVSDMSEQQRRGVHSSSLCWLLDPSGYRVDVHRSAAP